MATIRRVRKPNIRVTMHSDNRAYKIEERAPDIRVREPKKRPYKNK